jgi:hypothetical protein
MLGVVIEVPKGTAVVLALVQVLGVKFPCLYLVEYECNIT